MLQASSGFALALLVIRERKDYTLLMDSVRFGRALGMGARGAAKALAMAAEAAASQKPSGHARPPVKPTVTLRDTAVRATGQVHQTRSGLARGGRRFGEAVWGPFVKLSGVLWLELTGVFFGLFLLTALISTWKFRANLHDTGANHADHQRLVWSIVMAVVFGYFCVSSFLRAARRERGKS